MALQMFLFLLVVCLILSLALLWRLCWLHLQPSHSRGGAIHSPVQRLLKPHTPRDCPCTGYVGYPFYNKRGKSNVEKLARYVDK
jgi:hypothetical protein